jgi:hypothetical protein
LRPAWWRSLKDRPVELLMVCWFVLPLIILCLSSSKLGFYAMPLFPMMAIWSARPWHEKLPNVSGLTERERLALYARPAAVCLVIVAGLITAKCVLAVRPSESDMRLLWRQLEGKLPATAYELGTVDERADGLIFYGAQETEYLSEKADPYPTYSRPQTVMEELAETDSPGEMRLLLVTGENRSRRLCETLSKNGVRFEQTALPYERFLLRLRVPEAKLVPHAASRSQ